MNINIKFLRIFTRRYELINGEKSKCRSWRTHTNQMKLATVAVKCECGTKEKCDIENFMNKFAFCPLKKLNERAEGSRKNTGKLHLNKDANKSNINA